MKTDNYNDIVKALKRSSREEYGFCITKVTKNKKKYCRNTAKLILKKVLENE